MNDQHELDREALDLVQRANSRFAERNEELTRAIEEHRANTLHNLNMPSPYDLTLWEVLLP